MINKNKFSIKDTKKVLHKVGKRWVVVSAVLLGLAAGGAAVTTQANADVNYGSTPVAAKSNHTNKALTPTTNAINGAKAKVSSVKTQVKARIQQDSSYANVTNLTKLAKTVYGSSAASSAYQSLGSLAASASDYSSLSVGNTSEPASNTVFSMFSQASNDFNTISNAQSTSNGKHYLGKITSLFSEANSFANDTSLGDKNLNYPLGTITSSLADTTKYNLHIQGFTYTTPQLHLSSNVSINIPSIINSGINISSAVNDYASTFASENSSAVISTAAASAKSADGKTLAGQLNNSTNINKLATLYIQHQGLIKRFTSFSMNTGVTHEDLLNPANAKDLKKDLALAGMSSFYSTICKLEKTLDRNTYTNSNKNELIQLLSTVMTPKNINDTINTAVSTAASSVFNASVNTVASNAARFAGSLFATSGNSLSDYQVGPFAGYNLSSVSGYINKVNGNLSSANSEFASASSANSASKSSYMNSLGLPEALESTISGFISTASNYANKASHYVSDVTTGLNGFFGSKSTTKPAYNNLINAVAALPNDLQPTSNASSGSTEEAKLYSDYSNIASNTSDIDSAAMSHTAAYSNGSRIKRYVSDANRDATNSIVNEANSSANSMSTEMTSFTNAVNNVNNVINSIESHSKNSASYTNYASALKQAKRDISAISAESSAYVNSLANSLVNNSNASQFANDASSISLVSSSNSKATSGNSKASSGSSKASSGSSKASSGNSKASSGSSKASSGSSKASSGNSKASSGSSKATSGSSKASSGNSKASSGSSKATSGSSKASSGNSKASSGSSKPSSSGNKQPVKPASDNSSANSAKASASASVSASNSTKNSIANSKAASAAASTSASLSASTSASLSASVSASNSEAAANANNNNMPFIPSVPTFNNGSMANTTSASAEPSMVSGNSSNASAKSEATKYVEYAKINKALQLHTNPNFTKKNGVAVLEPNTRVQILHTVKARNGLTRYEVRYNHKNYYITANKKFVKTYKVAMAKNFNHYRYVKVDKTLQFHTSARFTRKNRAMTVKPKMEFHINHIVKNGKYVRYEVRYQGHNYFITANDNYVENAYLQKSNFHKHGYKAVRVTKKLAEYKKVNFKKQIRNFRKGAVLPVKRVITLNKGEMTRLQLTNGRYVSANKDFVKVIK